MTISLIPEVDTTSTLEHSRWPFCSNTSSFDNDSTGGELSSSVSVTSHSSSSNDSLDFTRILKLCDTDSSLLRPGDLESDQVEVPLHADVHFLQLPKRIEDALVCSRRILVRVNGEVIPIPFEPDEFSQLNVYTNGEFNPIQRRVLSAVAKENASGADIPKKPMDVDVDAVGEEEEDDVSVEMEIDQSTSTPAQSNSTPFLLGENGDKSFSLKEDVNRDLLIALGLSAGQIDRLINAPVWAPLPKKKSEKAESNLEQKERSDREDYRRSGQMSPTQSGEKSWEIAAILRPHLVKKDTGIKEKEYIVVWKDWPWYDQWSLATEFFDNGDKIAAADTRERLVSQMAAYMQQKNKQGFDEMFPTFSKRHDFTNGYRVSLRITEQGINDELDEYGIAPIYIENWTGDERAAIDVKYLTRCAMAISQYREAEASGRALRLQYPDDGAGCDCKDGVCTPSCPCIKIMGRDQIRMRSTGKVDVEKLAEATTVECGTTCSCSFDCPSRFAERGRKMPLVVMYTTTKGWSVFAPQTIPAGAFLGTYTGEIIPLCSAIAQGTSTSYQFTNIHQIPGAKQYVVDASRMGNETRYFNHACGDAANLKAVSLLSRGNLLTNNMLFFTKRTISKGEELTFSYRGKDAEEQKNGIRCLCTPGCQSRL